MHQPCPSPQWRTTCMLQCSPSVTVSEKPHGLYSPWNSPDQNTGVGSHSLLHGILPSQELGPGLPHFSPTFQADSLPAEPPGKPKNTRVGSLSLLQQIFPTQELNQGLLHCRWIPYQLNYQGSHSVTIRASTSNVSNTALIHLLVT